MLFFNHNEKNFHLKFVFKKIQYSPVVSYHYYFFLLFKKNVYHDLLSFTVLLFMYLFVRYWMLGAGALGRPRGMVWGGRREEGSGWGTRVYLKKKKKKKPKEGHQTVKLIGASFSLHSFVFYNFLWKL